MNLILSDVEETIMIVDTDGNDPQGTVNVRVVGCSMYIQNLWHLVRDTVGRETENGNAVCQRRWCHSGTPYYFFPLVDYAEKKIQVSPPSRT
jgi:hypothetical protein